MTFDQFRDMASEGIVVKCDTVQERRNVLELFKELGFEIGSASMEHLLVEAENDYDTEYIHPGFLPSMRHVSCYRNYGSKTGARYKILYDDIRELSETPEPLDTRSKDEFLSDFTLLLY